MRLEALAAVLALALAAAPALAEDAGAPAAPADPHQAEAEAEAEEPHGAKNPDRVMEDERLPAGMIAVQILDGDNQPVKTSVTLGILRNTVAKGESREHKTDATDAMGRVVFRDLPTGSGIAYRVSVSKDGAQFAATPFGLSLDKGTLVVLHVYPVASQTVALSELTSMEQVRAAKDKAVVLVEGILFAELKDDRVQMQQLYRIMNAGAVAWVPNDLVLPLPAEYRSFVNDTQAMSDVGLDDVAKRGVRLRGTFGPGQHEITFRWQLPYDNEDKIAFDLQLPPNTVSMRVMASASDEMRLGVEGFPPGRPQSDGRGNHVLVTERSIRRGEEMIASIKFALTDIPRTVPTTARLVVVLCAGLVVLLGITLAGRRRATTDGDDATARRAMLLADLEELVRAHRAGDIGPKTFERAMRDLHDAIARTLPPSPT